MPLLTGRRLERALASSQYRDGLFHNAHATPAVSTPSFALMREMLFGGGARRPHAPLPLDDPRATWARSASTSLRVTWLGHSTLLIEIDGARVLTDPVFAERASPVPGVGARRFHPPPVAIADFPPLDAVLLSHDHYDHLDRSTIVPLAASGVPIVTSLGVGARLERFGVRASQIIELDWWESHTLPRTGLTLTAAPAQHFSGRGLGDRNATLWSSWVLASRGAHGRDTRVFFSADTGLHDDLATIRDRLGPFDLTMLEIGAAHPAWAAIHLGPEGALAAFERLGGGLLLPVHWATFDLALHRWDEPAETLVRLAEPAGARVLTPRIGQAIEPANVEGLTAWWRDVHRPHP